MILRIDHELLEAQERRIYFCFFKNQNDEEEKNYFIIKNEMKKSDFFVCKTVNEQKKKLAVICYGPYLKLNWLINTTMMNMIRFYKVFLFML